MTRFDVVANEVLLDHRHRHRNLGSFWQEAPTLVVFLPLLTRRAAHRQIEHITTTLDALTNAGVSVVTIGMGTPRDGAHFYTSAHSRVPILLDPGRVLFRRLGLYHNAFGCPTTLAEGFELLASVFARTPKSVRRQAGGAFLVLPGGRVVAETRSQRPTDIIADKAINQMLQQLRTFRTSHTASRANE